ncbi:hypothetical protein K9M59_03850 [Candidatus Gracilibacteria bacterium]|nr:hypothetical protein [Candidatus Gracilibacteria bacterium]MCF7819457.1 hypothetical protein [Candidatus Gracilibacteria bacterium]
MLFQGTGMVVIFIVLAGIALIGLIIAIIVQLSKSDISMEKKFSWLRDLVNVGGTIVGIVLTAIGGVMFLNSSMKLYVFHFESSSYFNAEEQCTMPKYVPRMEGSEPEQQEKTPEEIEECIQTKEKYEKARYRRQQQEQMVDGVAFLIVGLGLWIVHHYRRKKDQA